MTARSPISTIVFGDVQLQVYYRDLNGRVAFVKNTGSWSRPSIIEAVGPGYNLAVLQWENGKRLRLYYQEFAGDIVELYSDNSGQSWAPGELHVGK